MEIDDKIQFFINPVEAGTLFVLVIARRPRSSTWIDTIISND